MPDQAPQTTQGEDELWVERAKELMEWDGNRYAEPTRLEYLRYYKNGTIKERHIEAVLNRELKQSREAIYQSAIVEFIKAQSSTQRDQARQEGYKKVDRLEVIDGTGRAYVKGSIYGSPVEIMLSLQDDGRTLKVFVDERKEDKKGD